MKNGMFAASLLTLTLCDLSLADWVSFSGAVGLTSTLRQGGYPYNAPAYNQDASGSLNASNQWSGQVICYGYSTQRGNQTALWTRNSFSLQAETFHNGGYARTDAQGQVSFSLTDDSVLSIKWETNEIGGWWGNNGVYDSSITISRSSDGSSVWQGSFSGNYSGSSHGASVTDSVTLRANIQYTMAISHTTVSGAIPYSPSRCDLTMSLAAIPSPAAAPLLALIGFAPRRRRG